MKKILLALVALLAMSVPAMAQSSPGLAAVVATCGTPPSTYTAGTNRPLTQNTSGQTCGASSGSVTGTVTANQGTPNAGGATNSWPVQGAGVAGTPAGGIVSIQGVSGGTTLPTTDTQGPAAAVTAGWPTTNGEPVDTTGTFTNGTQSGNVTTPSVDGYAAAIISIHGTYGTATATFQASDDGGTTFYPLACNRIDGSAAPELGYTTLTNTSRAWLCATQGFDEIQVLSSAVASGTVSVRISQSAAPIQAPSQQSVSQPTAALLNATVVGTGTFAVQSSESPAARTIVALDVSTVTTGGTAVNALMAGHRSAGGFLLNPRGATIDLCINEQGAASGTTSAGATTCIPPGGSYTLAPTSGAVSVVTSDSSHPFSGYGLN